MYICIHAHAYVCRHYRYHVRRPAMIQLSLVTTEPTATACICMCALQLQLSMGEIKTRRLGPKSKSDRCRGGTQNQINPGHGQQLGVPSRKDNKDILAVIAIGWHAQLSIKTPRGFWSNRVVKIFCCAAVLLYMCWWHHSCRTWVARPCTRTIKLHV